MPVVHLRSLVRAKGKAQPINGIKVGPPFPAKKAQIKEMDVKGLPRYPTKNFEVDAESGDFKQPVSIELARTILTTHGHAVRYPRYSTRYPAGYSHRAPNPAVKPMQVDEWILGEAKFLDRGAQVQAKQLPTTIMVVG